MGQFAAYCQVPAGWYYCSSGFDCAPVAVYAVYIGQKQGLPKPPSIPLPVAGEKYYVFSTVAAPQSCTWNKDCDSSYSIHYASGEYDHWFVAVIPPPTSKLGNTFNPCPVDSDILDPMQAAKQGAINGDVSLCLLPNNTLFFNYNVMDVVLPPPAIVPPEIIKVLVAER
jgi:hypothetical protein